MKDLNILLLLMMLTGSSQHLDHYVEDCDLEKGRVEKADERKLEQYSFFLSFFNFLVGYLSQSFFQKNSTYFSCWDLTDILSLSIQANLWTYCYLNKLRLCHFF